MVRRAVLLVFCAACSAASGSVLVRESRDSAVLNDGARDAGDRPADADADDGASPLPGTQGVCRTRLGDGFLDPFEGGALSPERWLVAHGNVAVAGERSHGGFLRENVAVRNGKLVLSVRGDLYAGDLRGLDEDGKLRSSGARTGAAIATRDLFMSATYQWEGRLTAPEGVRLSLVAMRDDPSEGSIAISAPGQTAQAVASYAFATAQVEGPLADAVTQQIPLTAPLDDGQLHSLRFDWHAGPGAMSLPAVDFWQDADLLQNVAGNAPARAARSWLAAFIPAGSVADFDTIEIEITTAFITTFGETRDVCSDGELTGTALETPR